MKNRIIFYSLILALLFSAIYFRNNSAKIYAQFGDFYYKKNNIQKAQTFYEKSFAQGNKNRSVREIYVNSLINAPLTIEAQEKLVKISEDEIQDLASYRARSFLYNLKREIHDKYPLNYIKQAPYNQQIVRWNSLPIVYTFKNREQAPQEYVEEINKAFSEWEKRSDLMFAEANSNANIIINFINPVQSQTLEYGKKYIVAYTEPQITGNNLKSMSINFYIKNPEGTDYTRNQIYNTALHEIFHALGFMGHSFEPDNVMYLAKNGKKFLQDEREFLTEADISTLKLLYKIKPDITNSDKMKSEYVPHLILGDDEELTSSKYREAKNYIRLAPNLPGGYIDLAESLVAKKKYLEAIKNLEKALRLADSNATRYIIYYNLAVSYFYIDNMEMSYDYLKMAMEIKDEEDLHQLKAEILRKKDPEAAKKEYAYLIQSFPENPEYVRKLANMYIQDKCYLKARKVLKDFIKLNPKYKNDKSFSRYGILLL